ncbi:MAG TPA: hypothetical protein VKB76_11355 [Ktedonobacterales bacterium]|nr:hypothetical protein [Ktedonobacterales bacterium]
MSKASDKARAFANNVPKGVTFKPATYKMIRASWDHRYPGEEFVSQEDDNADLRGVDFDPFEIGDLCVYVHSVYAPSIDKNVKSATHYYWQVCTRATTSRAEKQKIALGNGVAIDRKSCQIWRFTYPHLQAASKLLGMTFNSREELEAALDGVMPERVAA